MGPAVKVLIVIGLLCVIGAVLIGGLTSGVARMRQARSRSKLVNSLGGAAVVVLHDDVATCFGIESRGKKQVRGNGTLVLTKQELVFEQWVPNRVLNVPLAQIAQVDTTRRFLGRSRGGRLLRVSWTTPQGTSDRAAWQVQDVDAWLRALPRAPAKRTTRRAR